LGSGITSGITFFPLHETTNKVIARVLIKFLSISVISIIGTGREYHLPAGKKIKIY